MSLFFLGGLVLSRLRTSLASDIAKAAIEMSKGLHKAADDNDPNAADARRGRTQKARKGRHTANDNEASEYEHWQKQKTCSPGLKAMLKKNREAFVEREKTRDHRKLL